MSGERRFVASGSQTVGPFFHFALTTDASLGVIASPDTPDEQLRLRVRVTDGGDAPVTDCMVEVWQADADGRYVASPAPDGVRFTGFGRLPTDHDGACTFHTIRPGRVADGQGGHQASHLVLRLFMRGLLRHIHTRVYFAGDPALAGDAVLAHVPAERRPTLVAQPAHDGLWEFDVRLQGPQETVFFDI